MSDFIYDHFGWFASAAIIGIILVLGVVIKKDSEQMNRLMIECLADNHKEYECHSMLDNHKSTMAAPIYIGG